MSYLVVLIPIALTMGAVGLLAFLWALRSGQYEDLDGAAERVLLDDEGPPEQRSTPQGGEEPSANGHAPITR
jgi:cbb3-type cytochrome oxidase maturation protein